MMHLTQHSKTPLAAAVTAALLLAACGGGSGGDTGATTSATGAATSVDSATMDGTALGANVAANVPATQEVAASNCASQYADPYTVAVDMTGDRTAERQALLSKFDLAVINSADTSDTAAIKTFVDALHDASATQVAHYASFTDTATTATTLAESAGVDFVLTSSFGSTLASYAGGTSVMGALEQAASVSTTANSEKLGAVYLDGLTGTANSIEAKKGWTAMMAAYKDALDNVRTGGTVVFSSYGASPTDYAAMRYGLASALLKDGAYAFRALSGSAVPVVYDEYEAPLGAAVEAAPTAAASNGIYRRKYQNGIVLVNPTSAAATIDVGAGYRRLQGAQDPSVNTGLEQAQVTLPARSGLVMVKAAGDCSTENASEARESASATTYATPRIAALDYSRNTTATRKTMLSKFDFVILGLTKSMGVTKLRAMSADIKRQNSSILLAHYVLPTEVLCSVKSGHDHYDTWLATERADWWLYKANGSHAQWSSSYSACDINVTQWGKKNSAGQTWAQWKWQRDYATFFKNMPEVTYVHFDNVMRAPRVDADWKRNGTNQSRNDASIQAAFRAGLANNWKAVRSANSNYKISGNPDNDLSFSEYKGQLDFAFLEGVIGKSWSREGYDWIGALNYYKGANKNTKTQNQAILQAFTRSTDYKLNRYGLAMAMLGDGYYMQTNYPSSLQEPSWFDEFDVQIGKATESAPTKAASGTVWMRKYENGLVLVNSSASRSATINVGSGYKRFSGRQDSSVNNGRAETTVTLPARSGLLMVRR